LLIEKLDQFIRKYYVNQFIRGSLYSTGLILALFLGLAFLEYYFFFPSGVRKALFFSFIGVSGLALTAWVFTPLLHYFRLGKVISHEQAATIIGDHFANVKDKLLNVLQLKHQADSAAQKELILASINQKSEEIRPVPFKAAINLNQNRRYLKYALPPLLLLIILLFAAPSLITDGAQRLIRNSVEFERPAPFSFIVQAETLSVVQYEDFPLAVKVEGEQLPNEVFIDIDNYQYRLTKEGPNLFTYRFTNVQKDTKFKLFSSGVQSRQYNLGVLKKPNIMGFNVKLNYPAYTQRKDEELKSIGDLVVPVGTNIDWVFNSQNTENIRMLFSGEGKSDEAKRFSDDLFTYKKRALRDEVYKLFISNKELPNADSISYSITVIPDLYPNIKAEKFQDSTNIKLLFFAGEASDDYGLLSLSFNYRIKKLNGQQSELNTIKLKNPESKQAEFTYSFDVDELNLAPGDEVTYYFEVYDNDAVNGSKSARTNIMVYAKPTVEEYKALAEQNNEQIKNDLQKALEESRKIQEDMKKMREKLLQEKDLDWQSRKELEKMLDRQKELEKHIEQAKEAYEKNMKNQQEYSEMDEKILEKQEKLQELFENAMSEEIKELMKQIEELLQKLEKQDALEMMENMEMNDEELEMELDRLLELFKQLELEQQMQETIEELEQLAKEQEELSKETEQKNSPQEELQQQQEDINQKFDKLQEKMDEMEKKNEELERPKDLGDHEEQMQDIQKDLNNSQQQLQQNQNNKASQSQKNAAQKMQEMAQAMAMQMQSGEMQQMQEDMRALRQLLENLVGLSFGQEDLMAEFAITDINTPRYVNLVQKQFKLKDDFRLIEDSLQALSKRVFQIESFVTEKVTEIKHNMNRSLDDLEERRKPQAADHQQRAMTNVNDLALMLSEVMNQMQQQMSSMMAGNQMCTNPGGKGQKGQVPQDKMGQGQQELNQQLQQMKDALERGKGGSSKEFAEMAAKQAALRKALQEKQKKLQEQGKGSKDLQELIEQMDKTETELVNKKLTNEMLKRQQDILTRLLEHEKSEREREFEEKRKSEVASQKERRLPPSLEEYIKKREAEIEMYKTVNPSLKPYYKSLVEEYFKSLKAK
jgi:hypothetical protein